MKSNRYSEEKIIQVLKAGKAGMKTADICREHGIHESTYYAWKAKYSGMETSDIRRLQHLEDENRRLKQLVADLTLDKQGLQFLLEKKR
jgi:putative transposase